MTNNLLPFDPKLAKNGDVVIFEPRGDHVTFVGMYNGYAFCADVSSHVLPYAPSHLRLRPRMVKRKISVFDDGTWIWYGEVPRIIPNLITTIEIKLPEAI